MRAATELAGIINNDVPAPVRNIADNIDNNEQLNDVAPVENVGNRTNNNDPHDVVDEQSNDVAAPVCNIADSINDTNEQRISALLLTMALLTMMRLLLFVTLLTILTIMNS